MDPAAEALPADQGEAALARRLRQIHSTAIAVAVGWAVVVAVGTIGLTARDLSTQLANTAQVAATDAKALAGVVDREFRELTAMPQVLANSAELANIVHRYTAREHNFAGLTQQERVRRLLADTDVVSINKRLTAVRNLLNYDLIYALDSEGVRVVSSDWDQKVTLLGDQHEDFEYFKKAMTDGESQMFGVARATKHPVLFFAARLVDDSGRIGVIVVRQDSAHLSSTLAGGSRMTMIVDKSGMVVASSRPELALRHTNILGGVEPDDATLHTVYQQDLLQHVDVERPSRQLNDSEWLFEGRRHLVNIHPLSEAPYSLVVFSSIDQFTNIRLLEYGIGALIALFGVLIALFVGRRAEGRARQRHNAVRIAALNDKLVALNKDKDRYLGIAAHDLRNPLSSMRGLSELMLETPLEPGQQKEFLETIRGTSDEMLSLVNDLLDTSVIESGKLTLNPSEQDLVKLVQRRMRHLEPNARNKQIQLEVDARPTRTSVDAARFSQVIDNLISNAIKFSPSGTTVRVKVESSDGHASFSVQDQGPGIPPADRALLFRSFQKLSARPTGGEKSTGLGLAIVKKIVDAHGGTIDVDDAPGGGTRFTVKL